MMPLALRERGDISTWDALPVETGAGNSIYHAGQRHTQIYVDAGGFDRQELMARPLRGSYGPESEIALGMVSFSFYQMYEDKKQKLREAMIAGAELAQEMVEADEMDPPDVGVWRMAVIRIDPFVGRVNPPLVYPLQLGGVSLEWHENGINLEIRFRGQEDIYVVIEDAEKELVEFHGQDFDFAQTQCALETLVSRQLSY